MAIIKQEEQVIVTPDKTTEIIERTFDIRIITPDEANEMDYEIHYSREDKYIENGATVKRVPLGITKLHVRDLVGTPHIALLSLIRDAIDWDATRDKTP